MGASIEKDAGDTSDLVGENWTEAHRTRAEALNLSNTLFQALKTADYANKDEMAALNSYSKAIAGAVAVRMTVLEGLTRPSSTEEDNFIQLMLGGPNTPPDKPPDVRRIPRTDGKPPPPEKKQRKTRSDAGKPKPTGGPKLTLVPELGKKPRKTRSDSGTKKPAKEEPKPVDVTGWILGDQLALI